MKTLTKPLRLCLIILLCISCTEETTQNQELPLVTANVTIPIMDGNDIPNAAFAMTVDAPFNNVASYDMTVRFRPHNGDPATDFFPLLTVTTFPTDIIITTTDLAVVFGLQASDLTIGDSFDFVSTSTGIDGTSINYNDLPEELQIDGEQAYLLDTKIVCPLPEGLYTGDYLIESTIVGVFGPMFLTQNVELSEYSLCQRTFDAAFLEQFDNIDTTFIVEFLCDIVTIRDNTRTNRVCSDGAIFLNASELALPYSEVDDSLLIVNFEEDTLGCGGEEDREVQLTFTKL